MRSFRRKQYRSPAVRSSFPSFEELERYDFRMDAVEMLVARVAGGDVRALARALSVVEVGGADAARVVRAAAGVRASGVAAAGVAAAGVGRRALRIGVTGAGGAGKSTLVDQMVRVLRRRGERVGVLAVDPTSPFTGGALLGDRIRMQGFEGDAGVFIRSMASRGAAGGVAEGVSGCCSVMEAAGFGWVIVETVGVGQGEVSVAGVVGVTVLVVTPGMGDDVQSLKAGVMEAADVFVVNKADLPGSDRVVEEIEGMQGLLGGRVLPVLKTVGVTGVGVEELVRVVGETDADKRVKAKTGVLRCGRDDGPFSEVSRFEGGGVRVDHLGVAVRSIAGVRGFWEGLGVRVSEVEEVGFEKVRVAMVPMGGAAADGTRVELLEAMEEDSVIGRFVAKRGEGLHHVALRVDGVISLDARFEAMRAAGVRLASDAVRVGAGGHRYFFVHPASTGGVLVELVGE
jgi:LAO/AO transport system kinase